MLIGWNSVGPGPSHFICFHLKSCALTPEFFSEHTLDGQLEPHEEKKSVLDYNPGRHL